MMEPSSTPGSSATRPLVKRPPPERAPAPSAEGPGRPEVVSLSWENEDIENRWGIFRGGRFTSVNKILTFILAAILSALFAFW